MMRRLLYEDVVGAGAVANATQQARLAAVGNFDSSMVVTVLVLLTALFFMAFFSIYIRRFHEQSAIDIARHRRALLQSAALASGSAGDAHAVPPLTGADPALLRVLPVFAFNARQPFDDCAVCLAAFEPAEKIKMIPACGHYFHPLCIDQWLSAHGSCPLCRSTRLLPPLPKAPAEIPAEVRIDVLGQPPRAASGPDPPGAAATGCSS